MDVENRAPAWGAKLEKLRETYAAVMDELLACGGYPCQPFARPGQQRGVEDARAAVSLGGPVQLMTVSGAKWGLFENVATDLYRQSVDTLDKGMMPLGVVRANRFDDEEDATGLEVIRASALGAPSRRDRSLLAFEPDDAEELIGPCEPLEAYEGEQKCVAEFLDPIEKRDKRLIVPGDFELLEPRDIVVGTPHVIGYLNCGGEGVPLFWGSIVVVKEEAARDDVRRWRIYEENADGWYTVLPEDKTICGPRHAIHASQVTKHLRQRRPVISTRSISTCYTAFGEGLEGPGKILIYDEDLRAVRRYSGSELWRLGEDTSENLQIFNEANPYATDADRARAAGDGIARRYAQAVLRRTVRRMRLYAAAKKRAKITRAAMEVQRRWRGSAARAGAAAAEATAPRQTPSERRAKFVDGTVDGSSRYAERRAAKQTANGRDPAERSMRGALSMLKALGWITAREKEGAGAGSSSARATPFQRRGSPVSP